MFKLLRHSLIIVAVLAGAAPATLAAEAIDKILAAAKERWQCPIFHTFAAIRAKAMTPYERYLIVQAPRSYVQCIFFDNDAQLHCEAAAPAYVPDTAKLMTKKNLSTLKQLGYELSNGTNNHGFERPVPTLDTLLDTSGTMVETLVRVYGVTAKTKLQIVAPLADEVVGQATETGRCAYFGG